MCPDAHTIAGEFNRADLVAVLLKLSQISDKGRKHARQGLYQHQTIGYRARPLPHLGQPI